MMKQVEKEQYTTMLPSAAPTEHENTRQSAGERPMEGRVTGQAKRG
ncbi:hypothetical protein [Thermacetogenium phaeum]|nr:hypothetical protein [Thermacetogenium phaeum]